MDAQWLGELLGRPRHAGEWLRSLGVENIDRGVANLEGLARLPVPEDLLSVLVRQLAEALPGLSDPDMAVNNFDRFLAAARSPLSLGALFERDPAALPQLLQIFSTSQYLSDVLIRDQESYDLLRLTDGQPVERRLLVEEIVAESEACGDERSIMEMLRRTKHRETLRIAYGDIIHQQPLEVVTEQISHLADALCETALRFAFKSLAAGRGTPRDGAGRDARFVVLALGKLGGRELNYSSDIDLICLRKGEGKTDGARGVGNQEFYERLVKLFVKLLSEVTGNGVAYRVDLRLRPNGSQGRAVISTDAALRYYDTSGRTWERQAFVKARPVAGDLTLGREFLRKLEPWVYRRYLSRADISGIQALKRRIEKRSLEKDEHGNIKTGHGGIRDIEFVIQFLQLLNGGDLVAVRTGATLEAIDRLQQAGCLTLDERNILSQNYRTLRKVEHCLQVMFDLKTHTLPDSDDEMRRLAIRMRYEDDEDFPALDRFRADLATIAQLNRKILDHLLHDAFGDESEASPVSDLVLDPDPRPDDVRRILEPFGFRDVSDAHRRLMDLSKEKIPFLSTRRCRHFLAAIAPALLEAIARTPDPDLTLKHLTQVSDSLGGKGVLWELFSYNPPTLHLYVHLCATSPYLSGILTSNPGMIDELMDSLSLSVTPNLRQLDTMLGELLRGAEDAEPILHSFKDSHHLRVGVRDILGKEDVSATHAALSDIAEVCLKHVANLEIARLVDKYGVPTIEDEAGSRDCELVILALGKLGGREPNYHSDLDVIFLYEGPGTTQPTSHRGERTSNQHFFSQLAQRITKTMTRIGPYGRLYELDARLRPTGKSGSLAVSLTEFERYFRDGPGQLWERQSLCKARTVFGSEPARERVLGATRRIITSRPWTDDDRESIRQMRLRMEETARAANLKRGPGGTVDVEFVTQMLQLRHAAQAPQVLQPGTLAALEALNGSGFLDDVKYRYLAESYRFLRNVESRLRLINTTARHDFPEDAHDLARLAFLLGYASGDRLEKECRSFTETNRREFEHFFS